MAFTRIRPRNIASLLLIATLAACSSACAVHPTSAAVDNASAHSISLAGQWRFAMDRTDTGINDHWFDHTLADRIQLPGILQGQGYGDEISTSTPWVAALPRDMRWYLLPQYKQYTTPGHVKVPYLSQPPRHYLGAAWYQRDITIPANWKGQREQLVLERAHWQTTLWVDDTKIGSRDSLVAPHEYELGELTPGTHRLTIRIDNRMILPYRPDGHSVSDALGAAWNGIAGDIRLNATSPVWIDDAQVFPNIKNKSALIKIHIGNITGSAGAGTLTADGGEGASIPVSWTATGGDAQLTVAFGPHAQLWDEFHPNLQHLTLHLSGPSADDQRPLTFGLRQISADGPEMLLNGHQIDLRGTHSGGDFPLTGYPATDVASWTKIFQTCKSFGLNHMRFHSWCPPEAAFVAADQLGFYIQPECGMWNNFSNPGIPEMLEAETKRIEKAYGNHPSFLLLSASNEPAGAWERVLPQWAGEWYKKDPRRLYTEDTGRVNLRDVGPTYAVSPVRGTRGWFGNDFSNFLRNPKIPVVSHEVGQWCSYPNFDVIKKFTGYLQPGNYEIFRDSAAAHGVLKMDKKFAWASGKFQVACYKQDIEANLRTKDLSGYQLLDLHDYLGQGTALIGVLNTFWEPKGYVTAAEFRRFSGPTVPLARIHENVLRTTDPFNIETEIAHFGPAPLHDATPYWKIVDLAGNVAAQGKFAPRDIPIGKGTPLGTVNADLAKLPAPREYRLVVGIQNTPFENDWHFWLYPAAVSTDAPADVLVTTKWSDAKTRLAAGGKVLFTPTPDDLDNSSPPLSNVPVFWNRLMNPKWEAMMGLWIENKNPALAEFPTEAYCDWQWTDIVRGMRAVNIEKAPAQLQPIVQAIDDWNRNYKLGVVFECNVGPGRLVVCAPNIATDLDKRPVARQLRRSLLDYMETAKFHPDTTLTTDQADALWPGPSKISPNPVRPQARPGDIRENPTAPRRRPPARP